MAFGAPRMGLSKYLKEMILYDCVNTPGHTAFPKTEELKITGGALEGVMPKGVIHDLGVL